MASDALDLTHHRPRLRAPELIMLPESLGRFKASRLSFGPALVGRMIRERWLISCTRWDIRSDGRGWAQYAIDPRDGREFTFVVLSDLLAESDRGNDSYAERFDVLASLIEGPVPDGYQRRFQAEMGKPPTHGQAESGTLVWVRANRSLRSFDPVVRCLAEGAQPEPAELCRIGYLMRSEYYQATGMCGTRAFTAYENDHPLRLPYAVQSLGTYMMREFAHNLVDHLAQQRSASRTRLDPALKRYLGLGNSTGLGLVLFVNNHPQLLNRWIEVRESAIVTARATTMLPISDTIADFIDLLTRASRYRDEDATCYGHSYLTGPQLGTELRVALGWITDYWKSGSIDGIHTELPFDVLCQKVSRALNTETLECVHSILIDANASLATQLLERTIVDGIDELSPELRDVDPTMTVDRLRSMLHDDYGWIAKFDTDSRSGRYWTWFKDTAGEYPGRLPRAHLRDGEWNGKRFQECVRDVVGALRRLQRALASEQQESQVGDFLVNHPGHRSAVQWLQTTSGLPYATARMNVLHRDYEPMIVTRFVLECVKGFEKMEPIAGSGGRAIFLQGAPLPEEIATGTSDQWRYPAVPEVDGPITALMRHG